MLEPFSTLPRLAALGVFAAAVLLARPGWANPTRKGLSVAVGAEYATFQQGSGAPPLCCGERDDWRVHGAGGSLQVGYALASWLMPNVELGLAYGTGDDDFGWPGDTRVELTTNRAVTRIDFLIGGRLAFVPHLGWYWIQAFGTFESDNPRMRFQGDDLFMGPGVGVGLDYRLSEAISLRLDASGAFVSSNADGSNWETVSFKAVWWPEM